VVLLHLAVQPSFSQEACSSLLKFGLYDQFDTISSSDDFKLLQSWLCDTNSSNYEKASQAAGSAGFDLAGIIGLSAGGGESSSEKDAKYHQFCTSTYEQVRQDAQMVQHIRSINSQLMGVVKLCLDNQQTGFMAWIQTSEDRTTFSYFARYRPNGDEKAKIRAFDIVPSSVKQACSHTNAFRLFRVGNRVGNAGITMTCPVDPPTTVTITLNADKNGPNGNNFSATLDGVRPDPPVPPPPPTPVTSTFRVDAAGYSTAHQWLDTGLVFVANTKLQITASGQACLVAGQANSCSGPNGVPNANPQCAALGIVCGALFAHIGNQQPFFVGSNFSQVTAQSGSLYLGYADIDFANNSGGFDVTVTVTPLSGRAPAAKKTSRILNTVN
jgi:hypothetical protein